LDAFSFRFSAAGEIVDDFLRFSAAADASISAPQAYFFDDFPSSSVPQANFGFFSLQIQRRRQFF
jgi:hypothetical protein